MQKNYKVGLYLRLSRDDNNSDSESMSISNQRNMLTDYVKERGWEVEEIYIDDGITGVTFDRPAFNRLIKDIENERINMVVTKDLSRLGRNYLKVGEYTDYFFPKHRVRYIAVNDNYDNDKEDDFVAFRNIFNEHYAKDMHYSMKFQENVSLFSKMKSSQSLLRLIELSLDKMAKGGIYDQLKGGFHRYSVDNQWLVPHFEKMLYDNALALEVYAEGYQAFHNPLYKQRVQEIIRWLLDEMQSPTGGFYGTLDADSEGKEGSYYIWSFQELEELFDPNELDLLQDFYGVSKPGNFEGKNILFQQTSIERLATSYEISAEVLVSQLEGIKEKLLMKRATRVKPGLDDKIITAWNGLTLSGLISAYKMHFLENPADPILQNLSETLYKNLRFFQEKLFNNNTKTLFRIFHHEQAKFAGSLDDYVYLIRALLDYLDIFQILPKVTEQDLQEISRFLSLLMEVTIENFWNPEHSAFYYSDLKRDSGLNLSLNPKQNYDAPLPNPNVMMAQNIFRYLDFTNTLEKQKYDTWLETAEKVLQKQLPIAKKNPTAYASYYLTLQTMLFGDTELTDARFSSEKNSNEPLIHVYYPRTKLLLPKEENIPQLHNKLQICFHHSCLLNEISKI